MAGEIILPGDAAGRLHSRRVHCGVLLHAMRDGGCACVDGGEGACGAMPKSTEEEEEEEEDMDGDVTA